MKNNKKSWLYYVIAILVILFGGTGVVGTVADTETTVPQQATVIVEEQQNAENQVVTEEQFIQEITYCFRNKKLLNDHYEKHGKEMGFDSAESYETAANEIINNPDSLHRIEEEDGDDVYYLEETNGFVIVSIDGYIRTFFYPEDGLAYFNRQ
ncbi:MAG: hypothetical protein IKL49_02375 [Lachnospiraceae bacterium]|nr:hypothetical protein [Lachnospiraceae bacterium]